MSILKLSNLTIIFVEIISFTVVSCAQATSPSFQRQEVPDPLGDWDIVTNPTNTSWIDADNKTVNINVSQSKQDCINDKNVLPPDLSAVSFISDGNKLNYTLWFSSPIRNIPLHKIGYTLSIDIRSVYDAGSDYYVRLFKNPYRNSWNMSIEESASSIDKKKVLYQNDTSRLVSYGRNYITIPLNLSYLNFPDQYKVIFTAWDQFLKDDRLCSLIDLGTWAQVPPPKYTIITKPSEIAVRQGDTSRIEFSVISHANVESIVSLHSEKDEGFELLNFTPSVINVCANCTGTSHLVVKPYNDAEVGPNTVPLNINISFPTAGRIFGSNRVLTNEIGNNITQNSNFVIEVLPKLGPFDYLRIASDNISSPIGQILATVTALVGAITAWYGLIFRRKGKKTNS
jgi:hypothetical protein